MLDWLIIGGGIHGTHLSFALTRICRLPRDRVRVLDPYTEPLARWHAVTANAGMVHLRSPHVQNLDSDPWSISTFAKTRAGQPLADFIPTHNRPSLALFRAHSEWLIQRHQLADLRMVGRAQRLARLTDGWRVETESGGIESRRVVLAIGVTEQPFYPDWAARLKQSSAPLHHIFDLNFNRTDLPSWGHLVIVGGGITAAQTALTLARLQPGSVTLVMRHPVRVHDFDSDTSWINGSSLRDFQRESDFDRRRALIKAARHRGSMPADVAQSLQAALKDGLLRLHRGEVADAHVGAQQITLVMRDGVGLTADRALLATGFDPQRPGGSWLDSAVEDYGLPVAACGYPIVDSTLCWIRGLYAAGALGELELGAPARNIIGARFAGERLRAAAS